MNLLWQKEQQVLEKIELHVLRRQQKDLQLSMQKLQQE